MLHGSVLVKDSGKTTKVAYGYELALFIFTKEQIE